MKKRKMMIFVAALMFMNVFGAVLPANMGPVAGTALVAEAKSNGGEISRKKAKNIALDNAKKNYNINTSTIRDLEIEKDTYKKNKTWEVSFEAKVGNDKHYYEFEYDIARGSGKILHREKERD